MKEHYAATPADQQMLNRDINTRAREDQRERNARPYHTVPHLTSWDGAITWDDPDAPNTVRWLRNDLGEQMIIYVEEADPADLKIAEQGDALANAVAATG